MKMNRPTKRGRSTWNIEDEEDGGICIMVGCGCLFWVAVSLALILV